MTSHFFQALNPAAFDSGVKIYPPAEYSQITPLKGFEVIDETVSEHITNLWQHDLSLIQGILATFNALVGTHYGKEKTANEHQILGKKGVLDYTILPLLARKLITDLSSPESKNHPLKTIAVYAIAAPIEIGRFAVATGLTLLLAPLVTIVHFIKAFLPKPEQQKQEGHPTSFAQV